MALLLTITFLLTAFVGRCIIQYYLTGDFGLRSISRNQSPITRLTGALIVLAFISIIILSILSSLPGLSFHITTTPIHEGLGLMLCLAGILLTVIAQYQMGREWRMGVDEEEQTKLITHGLYSVIRNPIYTGVMLFGIGLLILIPHIAMLITVVVAYISIDLHVRKVEEPYLYHLHGERFADYVCSTGRYLPNIKLISI